MRSIKKILKHVDHLGEFKLFQIWLNCIVLFGVFYLSSAWALTITQEGKPEAELLIQKEPTWVIKYAAQELRDYIKKISGAELEIKEISPDEEMKLEKNKNYIFVGESVYTEKLGISGKGLRPDGFKILAGDNWIVFVGRDNNDITDLSQIAVGETGTLYAVYNFLERYLGVRWYMPGEIGEVIPVQETIRVEKINYQEEPDFEHRTLYAFKLDMDTEAARWYRRAGYGSPWPVSIGHSDYIFYDKYYDKLKDTHPECFALGKDGTRIFSRQSFPDFQIGYGDGIFCYSEPETLKLWVKHIRECFDKEPGRKIFPVGPNDCLSPSVGDYCQCAKCKAQYDSSLGDEEGFPGKYSNYVWGFVNKVAKEVYKTHPDRYIGCIAYWNYRMPPTRIERLNPNVVVMMTKFRYRYWDKEYKRKMNEFIDGWKKRSKIIYVWEYYNYYLFSPEWPSVLTGMPVIFSHVISEDLKRLKGVSRGENIEAEGRYWNTSHEFKESGLLHLPFYVTAKCLWEAGLDIDNLLDEYYSKFYGPAREEMKGFFTRVEELWMDENKGKEQGVDRVYSRKVVDELFGYLSRAKEKTKEDNIYAKRVELMLSECKPMVEYRNELDRIFLLADTLKIGSEEYISKPYTEEVIKYLNGRVQKNLRISDTYRRRADEIYSKYVKFAETERSHFRKGKEKYISIMISSSPRIDGILDDTCWRKAQKIEFVNQITGEEPRYKTDAYISWDQSNIYFAFIAYEPEMSKLKFNNIERDEIDYGSEDTIEIFLDTKGDLKSYYQLMINTSGSLWDAHWAPDSHGQPCSNVEWNSNAQVKVKRITDRWIMEMKVPLSGLELARLEGKTLRANFYRVRLGGEPEYSSWSPTIVFNSHLLDRFGEIEFR